MNRITSVLCLIILVAAACGFAGCQKQESPPSQTPGDDRAASSPAPLQKPDDESRRDESSGRHGEPQSQPAPALSLPPAQTDAIDAAHLATAQRLINGGVAYLLAAREADGGWSVGGAMRPAITGMALKALVQHPDFPASRAECRKAFEIMLSYQQKDGAGQGGIYNPAEGLANYTTAVAVMAMSAAEDPQYTGAIRQAVACLKGQQIVPGSETPDGRQVADDHPFVGGVSYGEHGRPDLSNLGMWAEAMHEAGVSGDDPAFQRSIAFLSRVQNRSESNTLEWAAAGENDGGFAYAPELTGEGAGESKAGPAGAGGLGLRSYGSMTYTGFKSMLYANVGRDDPRVQAAWQWIRTYWRLDSNPNMPAAQSLQGLYYYYHVFAKAMRAWGESVVTDAAGRRHNWREELIDALAQRVSPDGSWVNQADRWQEGSPVLVTSYAVIALEEAIKK